MADLTFYFDSTGTPAHDCTYSSTWDNTSQAVKHILNTTRGTSAIAVATGYRTNGQHLGCAAMNVSAAIATGRTFTPADTFDFVMNVQDNNVVGSSTLHLIIRVFNAAGDTVVGTLYDGIINATVWSGAIRSRHNDSVAVQDTVVLPDNGHIVVEVGMHDPYAATFGNRVYIGEGAEGNSALPLADDDTHDDYYPWLAFTYGAPAAKTNFLQMII